MKIYVVVVNEREGRSYAFLNKDFAETYEKECGGQLLAIESEELGWMKQAADAAVNFIHHASTGSLRMGELGHEIKNYEAEIYGQ